MRAVICGKLANLGADSGGVVFVTAFSGLFAPYWIDDCRGTICMFFFTQERYHNRAFHTNYTSWNHTIHKKRTYSKSDYRSYMFPDKGNS